MNRAERRYESLTAVIAHLTLIWQAIEAPELATRGSQCDTYHQHFEPELGQMLSAISAAFHRLAETLAMPHFAFEPMDLARAMSAVDGQRPLDQATGHCRGWFAPPPDRLNQPLAVDGMGDGRPHPHIIEGRLIGAHVDHAHHVGQVILVHQVRWLFLNASRSC